MTFVRALPFAAAAAVFLMHRAMPVRDGRSSVREGNELFAATRFHEAVTLYVRAADDPSAAPSAMFNRGLAHAQLGDVTALESFEQASRMLDGDDRARAHYNRGTLLARAGRFDEALAEFRRALRLSPQLEDARVNYEIASARARRSGPPPADARGRSEPTADTSAAYAFEHGRRPARSVRARDYW